MAYTAINTTETAVGGVRLDNIGQAGVAGGAGTGHKVSNDGNVRLYINNSAGNTPNIVVIASGTFKGTALTTATQTVATAANADYELGPYDPETYNDSDGFLRFHYTGSNESDLKIVPVKRPK